MVGGRTLRYWARVAGMAASECRSAFAALAGTPRTATVAVIVALAIVVVPALIGLSWWAGATLLLFVVLLCPGWKIVNIPARIFYETEFVRLLAAQRDEGECLSRSMVRAVGLDLDVALVDRYQAWCRRTEEILARRSDADRAAFAASDAQEQAQIANGVFGYQGTRRIDLRRIALRKRLENLEPLVGDAR